MTTTNAYDADLSRLIAALELAEGMGFTHLRGENARVAADRIRRDAALAAATAPRLEPDRAADPHAVGTYLAARAAHHETVRGALDRLGSLAADLRASRSDSRRAAGRQLAARIGFPEGT